MRTMGYVRLISVSLALALIALVSADLTPTPVTTAADANACVDGYRLVAQTGKTLPQAVTKLAPGKAMTVGGSLMTWGRHAAHVARYRRGGWITLSKRVFGSDAAYVGVSGTPSTTMWAVGYRRSADAAHPIIARRSPTGRWRWHNTAPGVPGKGFLTDVASRGRSLAWAVGYRPGRPGMHSPIAIKWNGERWSAKNPGVRSGESVTLAAVSVTPDRGVWIAGSLTRYGVQRPYIARRLEGRWVRMELPSISEGAIAAIEATSRNSAWAVGYRLGRNGEAPLVMRWDGASWKVDDTPGPWGGPALLMDVTTTKAGVLVISGSAWRAGNGAGRSGRMQGLMLRRENGRWSRHVLKSSLDRDVALTGVYGDPSSSGWAVGVDVRVGYLVQTCRPVATSSTSKQALRQRRAAARQAITAQDEPGPYGEGAPPEPAGLGDTEETEIAGSGRLRIVDRARAVGLPTKWPTWGAVIADFDRDGREDIFLSRHGGQSKLFLDRGQTFKASALRFGTGDRHGCAAADVDGSGFPDLYCSFGGARGQGVVANQLWLDPGGPSPRLHAVAGGAPEPLGRGRKVAFLDFDDDGRKDLLLGQRANRVDGLPSVNRVFLRDGPASFHPIKASGLGRDLGTLALDVSDFDKDGREDLVLVFDNQRGTGAKSGIRLYRNTRSGLRDVRDKWGVRSMGDRDAELVRLDGDDLPDLVQVSRNRVRVSLQRNGRFKKVYERALSYGAAVGTGDVDGDGDMDLYILRDKRHKAIKDVVLLNRGNGRSFRAIRTPSRSGGGQPDDVFPIDHDDNGMTDFLVLNGGGSEGGSVQLMSFYR